MYVSVCVCVCVCMCVCVCACVCVCGVCDLYLGSEVLLHLLKVGVHLVSAPLGVPLDDELWRGENTSA